MKRFLYSQPDNAVLYDLGLTQTQYRLYNIMVDMMNKKTHELTVKVRVLAKRLGRAIITTRRLLSDMAQKGVIIRIFNKSKFNPKVNDASTFLICGRLAKRYEKSEYAGDYPCTGDQKRHYPSAENDTHNESRESLRENLKDTLKREAPLPKNLSNTDQIPESEIVPTTLATPKIPQPPAMSTTSSAPSIASVPETPKTPNQGKDYDLSGVPDIIRHAVLHFLRETGRNFLMASEYEPIRVLSQNHTPERVMKEIDTAVERFKRHNRPLSSLYFGYIAACLSNQKSYDPDAPHPSKKKRARRNKQAENPTPIATPEQESVPELTNEIMPVCEAEKVISEYAPTVAEKDSEIPVALQELYERMHDHSDETDEPFTLEDYLRLKFPEADEEELRRDYDGHVHEDYDDFPQLGQIEDAFHIDFACAFCRNPKDCSLPKKYTNRREHPTAALFTNNQGQVCLGVKFEKCLKCKHGKSPEQTDREIEARLKSCGLSEHQRAQTFTAYENEGMPPEIVSAKAKAILAAKNHSNLILAGKAGTGKTHLATAIAIEAVRSGKRAIIVSVPEMLDELRNVAREHTPFLGCMLKYKQVPCLILDDWGKEKTTQAGLDYLYQIIDYRYKNGLQTIVTTNALNMAGLMNPWNADKIEPLVSRLLENGEWVTIRTAENHRLKGKIVAQPKVESLPAGTEELYAKIQTRKAECEAKINAYFASLPQDEDGCYVFPEDDDLSELPDFTFEDYLHMKFPEADDEELRCDYEGNMHEDYSDFAEYRKMEKAFRIDNACASCTSPEECCLPDGIYKGLRYPTIVLQPNAQGKVCLGIKYEEHLVCKHKCANCPTHEAVVSEKTPDPAPEAKADETGGQEATRLVSYERGYAVIDASRLYPNDEDEDEYRLPNDYLYRR